VVDILAAVLAGAPSLPGAKCRNRPHLFDEAAKGEPPEVVEQRHQQALGLCRICPALASCTEWFAALPARQRPSGVVAGRQPVKESI
jgi:WhiB family redox-sensing transcriptional regulator